MQPVLTADEYRRIDKAFDGDLTGAMDRAGYAVALAAVRAGAGYGRTVAILAGPGNNGGDGYVAAAYLEDRGADVAVYALEAPRTRLAIEAATRARRNGVEIGSLDVVHEVDVVVDALFGGGARTGMPAAVLEWMKTTSPVVAVDFPTGLDPNTGEIAEKAFTAAETVTFSTLKTGHVRGVGPEHCGEVTVVDIGINGGEACMYVAEEADAPRPPRARTAHKWSAGSVLVLGGSSGMVGASIFAGRAALRFGAGSVVVASPRRDLVDTIAPDLVSMTFEDTASRLSRFDVVVAGPGLAEEDAEMVRPLLRKATRIVLDAGGLTPATLDAALEGEADVVVTPHDGEFARVAGAPAGAFAIRSFAISRGVVVVRKGNPTMVTDGRVPVLVRSGGPELATIGTGDVLSGMIAALWARGLTPMEAAVSGAYWHGRAGADLRARGVVTADALAEHIARFAW